MIRFMLYDKLQSKGWTQRQLAIRTNIREATISQICNNEVVRINIHNLDRICDELKCSLEDIIKYYPNDK